MELYYSVVQQTIQFWYFVYLVGCWLVSQNKYAGSASRVHHNHVQSDSYFYNYDYYYYHEARSRASSSYLLQPRRDHGTARCTTYSRDTSSILTPLELYRTNWSRAAFLFYILFFVPLGAVFRYGLVRTQQAFVDQGWFTQVITTRAYLASYQLVASRVGAPN